MTVTDFRADKRNSQFQSLSLNLSDSCVRELENPIIPLPVFDERGRSDDDGLLDGGFAVGALLEQGPDESDALQRLAQTHFIRHDAALID